MQRPCEDQTSYLNGMTWNLLHRQERVLSAPFCFPALLSESLPPRTPAHKDRFFQRADGRTRPYTIVVRVTCPTLMFDFLWRARSRSRYCHSLSVAHVKGHSLRLSRKLFSTR